MMKRSFLVLMAITVFTLTGCFEDRDDNLTLNSDDFSIKNFIWKGMNEFYVYGDEVPDLSNDRFGLNGLDNRYDITVEFSEYLDSFETPEDLFASLVFDPGNTDRFSILFPDLFEALAAFEGTTETTGLRAFVYPVPGRSPEVFARVSLVLNGSNADIAGVERNMVISGIDGSTLTESNFRGLFGQNTYTINLADYDNNGTETVEDDIITPNGQSITVSRTVFTDNPVHRVEILNVENTTIGYLMYNSFRDNFETELNNAFGQFQAANIEHLVVDLRYNGGGAIVTAVRLASMITGQFNNEVFSKAVFGPNRQEDNVNFNFTNTISGGAQINSLNLTKVYVLTTSSSASASELLINSLRPYNVEVVQVGGTTTGKTTINRLLFDSPDFGTTQVTAAHTYALFPLIGDSTNKNDEAVPSSGLVPNIEIFESRDNFGTLGDPNEPLLAAAIADITGTNRFFNTASFNQEDRPTAEVKEEPVYLDGYMYLK
jgi:C-terminal processing protease CtpA/Prc